MHRSISQATHSKQHGAALMVMLVIIVVGVATFLVNSLGGAALRLSSNESTSIALAQAKEALIGYAVTYGDANPLSAHGFLPCPDVDGMPTEGLESANCDAVDADTIGRFPWRSLGLPPLIDGNGDCLWYAVTGTYKSNPPTNTPMHWDNEGNLNVFNEQNVEVDPNEVVAIVFSPGPIEDSQDRSSAAAPICGGNYMPASYLDNDTVHGKDNSDIASGNFIMPHEHRDVNGDVTTTINDQFIYITRQDIWQAIQLRIARETRACLESFAAPPAGGTYPWAAPINDTARYVTTPNTQFGRIPRKEPIVSLDPDILGLQDTIIALQTATNSCKVANNAANRIALDGAGDDLKDLAKDIRDNQPTSPPILSVVTDPAIDAGDKAQDTGRCADILADPDGNSVQTNLDAANASFDGYFPDFIWPGCTLFTSITWDPWRELVFYQVANGFEPGGAASCTAGTTCLSVTGSGHATTGPGNDYRAVVITAGGNLVPNRATSNLPDYLELENRASQADPTQPYMTYNPSDSNYQTTNDLVLCLDGPGTNCP